MCHCAQLLASLYWSSCLLPLLGLSTCSQDPTWSPSDVVVCVSSLLSVTGVMEDSQDSRVFRSIPSDSSSLELVWLGAGSGEQYVSLCVWFCCGVLRIKRPPPPLIFEELLMLCERQVETPSSYSVSSLEKFLFLFACWEV